MPYSSRRQTEHTRLQASRLSCHALVRTGVREVSAVTPASNDRKRDDRDEGEEEQDMARPRTILKVREEGVATEHPPAQHKQAQLTHSAGSLMVAAVTDCGTRQSDEHDEGRVSEGMEGPSTPRAQEGGTREKMVPAVHAALLRHQQQAYLQHDPHGGVSVATSAHETGARERAEDDEKMAMARSRKASRVLVAGMVAVHSPAQHGPAQSTQQSAGHATTPHTPSTATHTRAEHAAQDGESTDEGEQHREHLARCSPGQQQCQSTPQQQQQHAAEQRHEGAHDEEQHHHAAPDEHVEHEQQHEQQHAAHVLDGRDAITHHLRTRRTNGVSSF